MSFNDNARFDPSRVSDRRGRGPGAAESLDSFWTPYLEQVGVAYTQPGVVLCTATSVPDPESGEPFLRPFSDVDLSDALSAASSVGDDRIQESATGQVTPGGWTHGSSAQHRAWFSQGFETGDLGSCDTFAARDLYTP